MNANAIIRATFALPLGLLGGATAGTLFDIFFVKMIAGGRATSITGLDWLDVRFDQNLLQVAWAGVIWMVLINMTMGYIIGRMTPYHKGVARVLALIGFLFFMALIVFSTYSWMDWDLILLLSCLGLVGIGAGMSGVSFGSQQVPELLRDNQNGYKF